ncbi:MAG: 4-(cytidine 5'-diphospho)-2-C-methyl-D-erythritol kinase [Beijerinckiaceae bacterium]|nr:4-(cytidine 5'-diphospho)-2-C-methyl-D-erythritol kinase [Beijerinckiaceae bacterium]
MQAAAPGALDERAPAKVNLTLHVCGRREDGFHDLESLVVFAGVHDRLTLQPGDDLSIEVDGPEAAAAGPAHDNSVLKAARALAAQVDGLRVGAFHLTKRLPAAAGIGGGSSDAAAALRLLARLNEVSMDDPRVIAAARDTGSDVPVCLDPRARMMSGRGEIVGPPLALPPIFAVLVNPGVALSTPDVFAQIGYKRGERSIWGAHPVIEASERFDVLVPKVRKGRNDMEDAASVLAPVIVHVLAVLGAARGAKLARMSGSGATCFALFETCHAAARAARVIRRDHPGWWVRSTLLR